MLLSRFVPRVLVPRVLYMYLSVYVTTHTANALRMRWCRDPFLWQDPSGYWHALSHTYTHQPAGPRQQNSISGHLFARSLEGPWHVSPDEPYDNLVRCLY
eukprot:COSAG05_NODE_797_length_7249_cov_3.293007_3_plen_100_part_00